MNLWQCTRYTILNKMSIVNMADTLNAIYTNKNKRNIFVCKIINKTLLKMTQEGKNDDSLFTKDIKKVI